jgi:hypothetical protein
MASTRTLERPVIRRRHAARTASYRRERQEFGKRMQWEAVFFGLLAAIGLAASLVAMVLGGLVATDFNRDAADLVDRMAVGGGAIAVAILALSYMAGGYVAARMARFDGWRQGLGVWLLSALLLVAAAVGAWVAGGELDPGKSITLPSNPIDAGPLRDGGVVLAAVAALVALIFALIGGVLGERFHREIDRVGLEPEPREPEPEPEPEPDTEVDEQRTAEREEDTEPVVWQP